MVSVFDVAKYILHKRGRMSTWKIQKLCYYCQAWHATWTERRLIRERFEAWSNGPVCPELFHAHKGKYYVTEGDFPYGNPSAMDEDETESVDIVLDGYGDMDSYDLRELTHSEDPWKNARGNLKDGEPCNNEITFESMALYYGSL